MKVALAGLCALLLASAAVACAQIAGVQEVTFTSGEDASASPADAHDATHAETATEGGDAGSSLPSEDCPSCGGSPCCSPKHCAGGGMCCAGRGEACTASADCCSGSCDIGTGRCTGPCLQMGASPCVVNADCCKGTCNSQGQCKPCTTIGGNCTSDPDCCFGLSCNSSEGGTCMQL